WKSTWVVASADVAHSCFASRSLADRGAPGETRLSSGPNHLGLLGHGTPGDAGIPPGIPLRGQFPSELGFPLGGFQLYRRRSAKGPVPSCATFRDEQPGRPPSDYEQSSIA